MAPRVAFASAPPPAISEDETPPSASASAAASAAAAATAPSFVASSTRLRELVESTGVVVARGYRGGGEAVERVTFLSRMAKCQAAKGAAATGRRRRRATYLTCVGADATRDLASLAAFGSLRVGVADEEAGSGE